MDYQTSGYIESADDVDYLESAPSNLDSEDFEYLSIVVRSTTPGGLVPRVDAFSTSGKPRASEVLANANGVLILQVKDVEPEDGVVVRVSAANTNESYQAGGYELEAQFVSRQVELDELYEGVLKDEKSDLVRTLHIGETQLVHFALSAGEVELDEPTMVWAVIFDTDGQVLRKFATPPGETRSVETVLMTPGNYRVEFHAARANGQELPEVEFELLGKSLSLPIGPGISDPTNTPILSCRDPGADPSFCSPVDMPVTDPIVLPELSVPPLPSPLVSVGTPWLDPSWWYWNTPSLPISAMATPVATRRGDTVCGEHRKSIDSCPIARTFSRRGSRQRDGILTNCDRAWNGRGCESGWGCGTDRRFTGSQLRERANVELNDCGQHFAIT